jgi:Na+/melibiose symporter-like transporter
MPWYIFGTIMVVPCFMGIFSYPGFVNGTDDSEGFSENAKRAWYTILPALFNVGWASVQISHMSIVNSLSASNRKRDELANNRNGFTFAANIVILSFALLFFHVVNDSINQFRYLCFLALGLGSFSSFFYMFTINEPKLSNLALELDAEYKGISIDEAKGSKNNEKGNQGGRKVKTIGDWMRDPNFYVHGLVYMLVRIAINVTMTMQPFYLDKVTGFTPSDDVPTPVQLAEVPLLSYIASLIFSLFFQRRMIQCLRNRFYPMFVAIIIIIATSAPLAFLHSDSWDKNLVYPLSAF